MMHEEIEQNIKSSLNEAEAFQSAVEKIGQADQLQKEFKKVEKDQRILRAILLIIGWLTTGFILLYSVAMWAFDWNFFHFSPQWNLGVRVDLSAILVALTLMWFLAKVSRDKMSRVAALLCCVLLAAGSVLCFPSEKISTPQPAPPPSPLMTSDQAMHYVMKIRVQRAISSVFSRSVPSPIWFRGGRTLLLCLPGAFWALWTWRHLTQKRSPTHGNQPICSD